MSDLPQMTPHRAQACNSLSPMGKRLFKYIEFDEDEELVVEVRKHPIGLVFILVTGIFISAVFLLAAYILASRFSSLEAINNSIAVTGNGSEKTRALIMLGGSFISFLSLLITGVIALLYVSNVVFVTSEKIAEVMYVSVFHRRVMQMNIGKVEDITVVQKGILPRIFNYGSLLAETAGETTNPAFTYVPYPNQTSQKILQAHENYVEKYGN